MVSILPAPATVRVEGDLRIPLAGLSHDEANRLCSAARVIVRARERRRGQLVWVEKPCDLARRSSTHLVLPRGLASTTRSIIGAAAQWNDQTVRAPYAFASREPYRPQQAAIADAVERRVQGIALAATGAGKTGGACATIARVGQETLVLVPTTALAAQWRSEVARFLGVDAAVCTGGRWSTAPVVIATPTTAMNHVEELGRFGLLVLDEVQSFATESRRELIATIPARYRLGLTATLPSDHRGDILRAVIGSVIYRFDVSDGIASGALLAPTYEQVRSSFRATYDGPADWSALLDKLVDDGSRNHRIVELVMSECTDVCTLVLSSRLAHLDLLRDMFAARGARVAILSGETSAVERDRVLSSARAGELDVLLGSTVADEGIDIPGLGALVLAFPSKAEGRLMQRIGRVVRAAPGKVRPRIFDIVDDVGPLRRQAQLRRQAFDRAYAQAVAA